VVAFSPLFEDSAVRSALTFGAVLPLLWTALRCGERDTATAVLILSCFAVWGALAGGGPFAPASPDDGFLLLVVFMISISVVSLAVSAHVATRKHAGVRLRRHEHI